MPVDRNGFCSVLGRTWLFQFVDTQKINQAQHRTGREDMRLYRANFDALLFGESAYFLYGTLVYPRAVAGKCRHNLIWKYNRPGKRNLRTLRTHISLCVYSIYLSVLDQGRIIHAPMAVEKIGLELSVVSVRYSDIEQISMSKNYRSLMSLHYSI